MPTRPCRLPVNRFASASTLATILADCGQTSESIQWAEKARDLESLNSAETDAFMADLANAHNTLATLCIDAAENILDASVSGEQRACYEAGFAAGDY